MDTQFHSSWLGRWLSDTFFAPSWPYLLLGRLGLHYLLRLHCVRLLHGLHGLLPLRFHRHPFLFQLSAGSSGPGSAGPCSQSPSSRFPSLRPPPISNVGAWAVLAWPSGLETRAAQNLNWGTCSRLQHVSSTCAHTAQKWWNGAPLLRSGDGWWRSYGWLKELRPLQI